MKSPPLSQGQITVEYVDSCIALFRDGRRRMASSGMPFADIDRKLIAIECQELAEASTERRPVEVGPEMGMKSLGFAHPTLESGLSHQPVRTADILEGVVEGCHKEVNASNGI